MKITITEERVLRDIKRQVERIKQLENNSELRFADVLNPREDDFFQIKRLLLLEDTTELKNVYLALIAARREDLHSRNTLEAKERFEALYEIAYNQISNRRIICKSYNELYHIIATVYDNWRRLYEEGYSFDALYRLSILYNFDGLIKQLNSTTNPLLNL